MENCNMFSFIRKADIILFCVLLLSAGISAALIFFRLSAPAGDAVITLNGSPYGTYSLDEDRRIEISGEDFHNVVLIENGSVRMESSDCHNQVCVSHMPISRSGESIICLPHRIVVRIQGGKEADVDAVAQ